MASGGVSSISSSSGGPANQEQPNGRITTVFPEEAKIRELAEQISTRFSHAHQLKSKSKLAAQQQQQQTTAATTMQIIQAEEMTKRLQEAINRLQEAVRDYSLTGLYDRLGVVAKKLNLKVDLQPGRTPSIFLVSDAFFYIEVCCQDNGTVSSVKLAQANTPPEDSTILAKLLVDHRFSDFEAHIQALVSLYSNATTANVSNVYKVLHSLERVLTQISENSPQKAVQEMIMENPLGYVSQRSGGLPMYLTFFIHPYDILKSPDRFKNRHEVSMDVGVAGKVLVAKSVATYRVSIDPNRFNFSTASFFPLTLQNSALLPLTLMVELTTSIPVSGFIQEQLKFIPAEQQSAAPQGGGIHINQLIAQSKANQEGKEVLTDKWRLVCLPSQYHYYLMPAELRSRDPSHDFKPKDCGVMLSNVKFVHTVHIFQVLMLLRKQLTYNTLLSSCLGRSKKGIPPPKDMAEYIFELSSIPPGHIAVAMNTQDPLETNKIIIEFVITDQSPTEPIVQVKIGENGTAIAQPKLTEVVTRCLSIPVTLQAALKYPTQLLDSETADIVQCYHQAMEAFNSTLASSDDYVVGGDSVMVGGNDGGRLLGLKRKLTN